MIRRLLVGIDASPGGDSVLELAIRWAMRYQALLVGLGVIDEPGLHGPEETLVGEAYFTRVNQAVLHDTRQRVDRALERCALRCTAAGVAFKLLEDVGTPYVQILREAQRYDLILLGRQTHFRFGRETVGDDTLARVLAASPRPVIAVPESLPADDAVLIAYDGSLQAARALGLFEASGLGRHRDVHVLCAADDASEAARHADRAVEFLWSHDIRALPHTPATCSGPAKAILEFTRRVDAGLLVMGAYGQPILREFVLGSVTRQVLKRSLVPVFLYH